MARLFLDAREDTLDMLGERGSCFYHGNEKRRRMSFAIGRVVVTPKASEALRACGQSADDLLSRHQSGDWGDASEGEQCLNKDGFSRGSIVSVYVTSGGIKLRVFTKADRSCTLIHVDPRGR